MLIELFSGFKNRRPKKTAQSKVISGSHLQSMLETGETIAKKDSVSSTTKMETSMKVCGRWINDMVREHTGEMKIRN